MGRIMNRREFMAMLLGTGATLAFSRGWASKMRAGAPAVVPRREFGNTGVRISKLCLGGWPVAGAAGLALLDEALGAGVDCWELMSTGGKTHGEYFKKHPGVRERVFLSGKTTSTDPAVMEAQLDRALNDLGEPTIDFFAAHTVEDPKVLTADVRKWAESAKKRKKIRFFGFCTHRNMDNCLDAAAGMGWIDGVQTFYNYRLQGVASMEDAMRKCHAKGIGLFAIKTMGLCVQRQEELKRLSPNEAELDARFAKLGMSIGQAKLKAVWQNPAVSSICSLMSDPAMLKENVAAAMDESPLDEEVRKALAGYAEITGRYFCRCCGMCEAANTDKIPIFSIIRLLLFSRGYCKEEFRNVAAKGYAALPEGIRKKVADSDYAAAEKVCPQKMPLAQLMKEASQELAG